MRHWLGQCFIPVKNTGRARGTHQSTVDDALETADKTGRWIRKNSETWLNSCESGYDERFCQGFTLFDSFKNFPNVVPSC